MNVLNRLGVDIVIKKKTFDINGNATTAKNAYKVNGTNSKNCTINGLKINPSYNGCSSNSVRFTAPNPNYCSLENGNSINYTIPLRN